MTVKQQPLQNGEIARPRGYQGVISGSGIERALVFAIQLAAWLLVVMSVLGTFYGSRGLDAPLSAPWRMVLDIIAAPQAFLLALLAQAALALIQWGGKRIASRDPRFWLLYLGSLTLSVYWNWSAYGDPLLALHVPIVIAGGLILAGDVMPELALIKE